jgi:gliding motility-associated-like protein
MTVKRTIAFICFSCLLLTMLSGQQLDPSIDSTALTAAQILLIESMAVDSVDSDLDVPNVFTPNGDGTNDYFEVHTDGTTVYKFTVFTRGGSRIYHSLSPRIFWDGNSAAGEELSEGIYYYVIEEEGDSERFEKAGFIHLYR